MSISSAPTTSTLDAGARTYIAADLDSLADLMRRSQCGRSAWRQTLRRGAESLHAFTGPRVVSVLSIATAVAVALAILL